MQELINVDADLLRGMPSWEKHKILEARKEWLIRSRKQDKKELISQERKKYNFKRIKLRLYGTTIWLGGIEVNYCIYSQFDGDIAESFSA